MPACPTCTSSRSAASKDVELLVLRHEVDVAGRERGPQRLVGLQFGQPHVVELPPLDVGQQLLRLVAVAAQHDLDLRPPRRQIVLRRISVRRTLVTARRTLVTAGLDLPDPRPK